jgi:hypothetical protein
MCALKGHPRIITIGDGACAQANSCGIAVPCQYNSADTEFEFPMLDERQKIATHMSRGKAYGTNIDTQDNILVRCNST